MPSADTIATYGLIRPAMGDALVAVHRAHGGDAAKIWAQLLTAAGLAGHETSDSALDQIVEAMTRLDPITRVIGRGLKVRVDTYRNLEAAQKNLAAAQA